MSNTRAISILPGIMISQCAPKAADLEGETLRCVEWAAARDDVRALQVVPISSGSERHAVADVIRTVGLALTCSLGRHVQYEDLNLSSLHEPTRAGAVEVCRESIGKAVEMGASRVQLVSGKRPLDPLARVDAIHALEKSLRDLARGEGPRLMIEPLETEDLRHGTLGSTSECVALCERLRNADRPVGICFDTAHALLNGEEPSTALAHALPFVEELHLCNCVTDPTHALYGDGHIPFGDPGRMDMAGCVSLMDQMFEAFPQESVLTVFCEVRNDTAEKFELFAARMMETLTEILGIHQEELV